MLGVLPAMATLTVLVAGGISLVTATRAAAAPIRALRSASSDKQPPSEPDPAGRHEDGTLVAFTLVRGGQVEQDYETFVDSRRCLRAALPAVLSYDYVAFHESNIPLTLQQTLRSKNVS
eukprot:959510-Prymnesium_polylepis.2